MMIKKILKHEPAEDLLDELLKGVNNSIAPFSTSSQLLLHEWGPVSGALETVNRIFQVKDAIQIL
jgi:hypothetical protein